jgi:hypothetical protein
MDKGSANIDIVFRNGLKDFEVLPPPEVWDNIHPVVKRKPKPFLLLRAAALITIFLSISFLAYMWNREFATRPEGNVVALNVMAASPIKDPVFTRPVADAPSEKSLTTNSEITFSENVENITGITVIDKTVAPAIAFLQGTKVLSMKDAEQLHELFLASLNTSQGISYSNIEYDQQYIPGSGRQKIANRWSIAAIASPTYNSSFSSGKDELSQQLLASEENVTSYSGGITFSYKVNKRLSIQSGLFYSSVGQMVDGINSFSGFQKYDITKGDRNFEVLTTNGLVFTNNGDVYLIATGAVDRVMTASAYNIDGFDPRKANLQYLNNSIRQNFSYLELPVVLRYKFIDKKIDFNVIGGISYNMLVNNSVFTMVDGARYSIGKTDGLNQISLSSSVGMGMEYNFSDKLSLNLEPTFRYYLNPYNNVTGSNIHPYSFGLFSGVSYKF